MEKFKKHWKEILLCIFVLLTLNKCTVACNRASKIDKQNTEIIYKDSVIKSQADSLNILKIRWNDAQNSQSTYQGIALGNQQELINKINELTSKVNELSVENNNLKTTNTKLNREIQNLNNQLKQKE